MLSLSVLIACAQPTASSPAPAPAAQRPTWSVRERRELPAADAVAAADMDGDGVDEVVWVREGVARWLDQEQILDGRVQVVSRADIDGDGKQEALVATGVGRGKRDVPARLWALGATGARELWTQDGPRPQVVDLQVVAGEGGDRVFLVAFEDSRMAVGGWVQDGGLEVVARAGLSLAMVPIGPDVAVTRLYGDEPKSPGDAHWLKADGTEAPLPTHRGVRAATASDIDGDGRMELFLADGWHHAYGEHADPLVRMVPGDPALPARTVARLDGSYAVMELQPMPDGILMTGSHSVAVLQQDALGFSVLDVAEGGETDQAVFATTAEGPAVLVGGTPAREILLAR